MVVAAGNDGPGTVSSPASDPALLAVGATDDRKTMTPATTPGRLLGLGSPRSACSARRKRAGVSLGVPQAPGSIADTENPDASVADKYFKGDRDIHVVGRRRRRGGCVGGRPWIADPGPGEARAHGHRILLRDRQRPSWRRRRAARCPAPPWPPVDQTKQLRYRWDQTAFAPEMSPMQQHGRTSPRAGSRAICTPLSMLGCSCRRRPAAGRPMPGRWRCSRAGSPHPKETSPIAFGPGASGRRRTGRDASGPATTGSAASGRGIDWSGRKWSSDTWMTADWAGRKWSSSDWLAFAWTTQVAQRRDRRPVGRRRVDRTPGGPMTNGPDASGPMTNGPDVNGPMTRKSGPMTRT